MEETKAGGRTVKAPKTARGRRTIEIDSGLLALLIAERDKHLRAVAGIPDGAAVDLSLVRLPEGAVMFPSSAGDKLDLTQLGMPTPLHGSSADRPASAALPSFASMICEAATRRSCWTRVCLCMWSRRAVGTIRRCCCGPTSSGPARRIPARLRLSSSYRAVFYNEFSSRRPVAFLHRIAPPRLGAVCYIPLGQSDRR